MPRMNFLYFIHLYVIFQFVSLVLAKNGFIYDAQKILHNNEQASTPTTEDYVYPRNISDIYRGNWNFLRNDTSVSSNWLLKKQGGHVLFQILSKSSPLSTVDIVKGDLIFRDGIYSTDESQKFSLQGLYFWRTGNVLLLANPATESIIQDFALSLQANSSFAEVITETEDIDNLVELANTTWSGCYFKIIFKVKSMSSASALRLEEKEQMKNTRSNDIPQIKVAAVMRSPNCNILLTAEASSISFDEYYLKATNYVIMVTFVSFIQILLLIRQMEFTNTQAIAAKVSLLTIGLQAIMDSYICLVHLATGIVVETIFNAFATAAFFKFITFSVFEMRYLLLIWKARRPQAFAEGWNSMRQELGVLYARFYASLMGGFVLFYFVSSLFQVYVFILYSFWIPQIICNIERDSRGALTPQYLFGITFSRMAIPLYFYACPYNFIHVEPNYFNAMLLFWYLMFQVSILLLQDKYGPRFFIPKRFLPVKYDYHRPVHFKPGDDQECVICMTHIETRTEAYMITPCNHVFHSHCISHWMNFKMECPTCRRSLPPL